jgi:SAM-dependent methyltransferase
LIVLRTAYRTARSLDRWISPVFDLRAVLRALAALARYPLFLVEYVRYRRASDESVSLRDLYPCLDDRGSSSQSGSGHYFFQDTWALARVLERSPAKHVDIGSRIDGFAGQLSAVCPVEYIDIRPVELGLERFAMREGSLLGLPCEDRSVDSLSCLHVIEHVGLGRYGDPVDTDGSRKAALELVRVLAPGGQLAVGVPIGRERVAFNAHRIHSPLTVIGWFAELRLTEFSVVTDSGLFMRFAKPEDYADADYACGLFLFARDR